MASLTASQLAGLDIASQRIKRGATYSGYQTDLKNLNYAKSTYGYSYTPKSTVTPTTPIPAGMLGTGSNYDSLNKILGANITPNQLSSDTAGLLALSGADTASKKEYDTLTGNLTGLMDQLGNKGADTQAAYDAQGVGTAMNQVKELNLKAAQLQGEIGQFDAETEKIKSNLGDQAIPTGLIQGQQAQLNEQRTLAHNAKVAELTATTALSQAFQGNANLGMELSQKAVDMKYAPLENRIETLKAQIGFAKENMSREDAKRAEIINAIADEQKAKLAEAKAKESSVQSILIEAAGNGAPLATINALKNSDPITASSQLSQYLTSTINRKSKGLGEKPLADTFKLSTAQEQALIGAGLSTTDIQNIQDNLRAGYTLNDILAIPGLSEQQKQIIGSTMNAPEANTQFLNRDYFASMYGGFGSKALKDAAKKAGYGGFMGGLTGVSKAEQNKYLDSITGKIQQYRNAGYTDKEILKLMQ